MRSISPASLLLTGALALAIPAGLAAQPQGAPNPNGNPSIVVEGIPPAPDPATLTKGPEIKGIIAARTADKIRVTTAEGASVIVNVNETTRIRSEEHTSELQSQ